jgi:hypothetical protein
MNKKPQKTTLRRRLPQASLALLLATALNPGTPWRD